VVVVGCAEAVEEDGAHQALHGCDGGQAQRAGGQLLVEDAGGLEVGALAADVLRVAQAEVAELSQPPEQTVGKLTVAIELLGDGKHLAVHEVADAASKERLLLPQLNAHRSRCSARDGRPLRSPRLVGRTYRWDRKRRRSDRG